MRASRLLPCLLGVLVLTALPLLAATTERVSLSSVGGEASLGSHGPSISSDGRYVAFYSAAPNLVDDDTNGVTDAFVHDRQTGDTEVVSVASDGTQGNGASSNQSISASGRYVAFTSSASNLVPDDTNGSADIFVHDRETGQTERVSVASDGTQGNADSFACSISGDGRYVAFQSGSTTLAPSTNIEDDIFVHDRQTGETERVTAGGGDIGYMEPSISADGRYVAFVEGDLRIGGPIPPWQIFVFDRETEQTEQVSVSSDGAAGNNPSQHPCISADGRLVAFRSDSTNLVAGDTNGVGDIFVHDRETGQTERVSVASDGTEANAHPSWYPPSISADGRCVAFGSPAANLVPGDTRGKHDIFVRDRESGQTARVSVASDGTEADGDSLWPSINADGRLVAFHSAARNLVDDDTNEVTDTFVRDRQTFPDVPVDFWAFYATEACVNAGVVAGYEDGLYHPEGSVTRDQMAVYIARALEGGDASVPAGPAEATFDDVPTYHWAYKYVEYCYANEVVQGYDPTTYAPTVTVTRDQMAVYVARAMAGGDAGVPEGPSVATFDDVPTGHWAYKYVEYCYTQEVVQGYDPVTYEPDATVTRDQMAVYVARAFGLL